MNKKWIYCALNCEGVFSDHRNVTAKILLSLRSNATQTIKTAHDDWYLIDNRDISDKYTITLRNKFDALQEIPETITPNDEYDNFVNAHMEATAECILTKHRVPWETLAVKKKTRQLENSILM